MDNDRLTNQLLLVINGAVSSIPVFGYAGPASQLKSLATHLIDLHLEQYMGDTVSSKKDSTN